MLSRDIEEVALLGKSAREHYAWIEYDPSRSTTTGIQDVTAYATSMVWPAVCPLSKGQPAPSQGPSTVRSDFAMAYAPLLQALSRLHNLSRVSFVPRVARFLQSFVI